MPESAEALRGRLTTQLRQGGTLTSPAWVEAFASVPREAFVPRYFLFADTGGHIAVGSGDPDWLPPIYEDRVLPTQLDGDDTRWDTARTNGTPIEGVPTCSLTQPSLTALMLESLDVQDGSLVLEVGAGTGYNAALLAHRLGSDHVTTIDIDPVLTARARQHLDRAGFPVVVLTADGAGGAAEREPYDRLIATCSLPIIPTSWLRQVRPGGRILTNLHRSLFGGPMLALDVEDDDTASGNLIHDGGVYMPTRTHPPSDQRALLRAAAGATSGVRRDSGMTVDPHSDEAWHVIADLTMSDVTTVEIHPTDSEPVLWLLHPDGSWAIYFTHSGIAEQAGPRELWAELEKAHDTWLQLGKPGRERFGLTVTLEGRYRFWLDDPENAILDFRGP